MGCKLSKVFCSSLAVPGPERTILVVLFAPEHNWLGVGVGLDVAAVAVPLAVAVGVVILVLLHWKDTFCDLSGASEILNEV